jgi:CheY-like chemotaxis protein
VLTNLVVNANDAMPNGGELTLTTKNVDLREPLLGSRFVIPPGSYIVLEVADRGTGMDEAVISRLFDPFFTTKDRGKGTGLGLSTVYGIVTQGGGHVHVESQPGSGSTFRVYFPRVDEQPTLVEVPGTRVADGGAGTILVVEDDARLLSLVGGMLERSGYHVIMAPDAEHALPVLGDGRQDVHVLLSDVVMPGLSGAELASRAWELYPDLPVIFMSGYADPARFPAEVRQRASGYIAKPFQSETLLRIVAEVLAERVRIPDTG